MASPISNPSASAGTIYIRLQWTLADSPSHAYTEIWRSSANDVQSAIRIGDADSDQYTDTVQPDKTYYYWLRAVDTDKVASEFVGPTSATSGQLPVEFMQGLGNVVALSNLSPDLIVYLEDLIGADITVERSARITDIGNTITYIDNQYGDLYTQLNAWGMQFTNDIAASQAYVDQEVLTVANQNTAIASTVNALNATLDTNNAARAAEIAALEASLVTKESALATQISELTTSFTTLETTTSGLVSAEATTRSAETSTLSQRIDTVEANFTGLQGTTAALVQSEAIARATETAALAQELETLTTTVGDNTASLTTLGQSVDGIEASYSIATDVNGRVAGIKLLNSIDEPTKFEVTADKFAVLDPVDTSNVILGTDAQTGEVFLNAANVKGTLQSTGYSTTSAGWQLTPNGGFTLRGANGTILLQQAGIPYAAIADAPATTETYESASTFAPSNPNTGDIWYTTDTKRLYRYNGAGWAQIGDITDYNNAAIANANVSISSNGTLVGGGGGKVTITGLGYTGALNADKTDYNNAAIANSQVKITADGTLTGAGGGKVTLSGLGYSGALDATKNQVFAQDSQPTSGMTAGDIWFDTNDSNAPYRYSGSAWVSMRDGTISVAQATASSAASTASTASSNATTALNTANAKTVTFVQDAVPTALAIGDLWFDSNDSYKMYRAAAVGANSIGSGAWVQVDILNAYTTWLTNSYYDASTDVSGLQTSVNTINNSTIPGLQNQIDGKVEALFGSSKTTYATDVLANAAIGNTWFNTSTGRLYVLRYNGLSQWNTSSSYTVGTSVYYNSKVYACIKDADASIEYTNTAYWQDVTARWVSTSKYWYWWLITDPVAIAANQSAASAQAAADGKITTYTIKPSSGMSTGDLYWDGTNKRLERYNGSAWQVVSVTNTNEIDDGAGLGTTANWSGINDDNSGLNNLTNTANAGATFTDQDAGAVAYLDEVPETYIANLAVSTLKIKNNAVTIPALGTQSGTLTLTTNSQVVVSLSYTNPSTVPITVQVQATCRPGTSTPAAGYEPFFQWNTFLMEGTAASNGVIISNAGTGVGDFVGMTALRTIPANTTKVFRLFMSEVGGEGTVGNGAIEVMGVLK